MLYFVAPAHEPGPTMPTTGKMRADSRVDPGSPLRFARDDIEEAKD
jgi:hypothetical protein